VCPEAEAQYRSLVTDSEFADGTLIVEWLEDTRGPQSRRVLALERRDGAWHYWELDANGRGAELGPSSSCQQCHAAAPAPPVFGLPRKKAAAP
jgi:hypothetical protein